MAKGARSSSIKANNSALKAKVFGPVENARAERLNAKLMELISQPKPSAKTEDADMEAKEGKGEEASAKDASKATTAAQEKPSEEMEVDAISKAGSKSKNRISKRRVSSRKSQMTFTTYKNGKKVGGGRKQKIY
ncbi:putative gpi ethanolamine phosphate transferase protein [Botrytis fragariae]|uniref:Putative gpi ethanolamine phosphate transferase protein n=1 Tax=Botrytis fragariae TaxID=1964551 RepID=A0A8H6APG2_9HELO|nr:putative gpi ethanolamine phosphate transferase protein [Botrytis fragariae]KAF5871108.1 putative gpi ethanolamine phosphate transferase protein [Botrytis fragariae]